MIKFLSFIRLLSRSEWIEVIKTCAIISLSYQLYRISKHGISVDAYELSLELNHIAEKISDLTLFIK